MLKKYYLIIYLFFSLKTYAINYFVSSIIGNDSYSGTSIERPFKTIQKAANSVVYGDTVNIMNGTYKNSDNEAGFFQSQIVFMMHSGKPDAWITFQALEGHHPILKIERAFGIRIVSTDALSPKETLAYIRIKNLTIQGNNEFVTLCDALKQPLSCYNPTGTLNWDYNGSGISIGSEDSYASQGRVTHHIEISNCIISDCNSSGIGAYRSDYVTIENCKIFNTGWRTVHGSSGIHIYNPRDSSFKDDRPFHFIIKKNELYNNRNEVPFFNGKECHGYTDGNGIIIDDAYNLQSIKQRYTGNFLIENNVIYDNGGSGISIFQSDNVLIRNNSTYKNCQLIADKSKRAELLILKSNDVKILNNIFYSNNDQKAYFKGSKCKRIVIGTNIFYNGKRDSRAKNTIKLDPLYIQTISSPNKIIQCNDNNLNVTLNVIPNSTKKDLRIRNTSPAINKGNSSENSYEDFNGSIRPQNEPVTLGAFQN